jgi:glycosyltransferase involved in cell wall biosynthesis
MKRPVFSIIIPTRERPETLRFAMQSVLCQDGDDIELVISDNLSGPATAKIALGFNDPRVVYVRADRRLSMCDNWDFAFKHARGDYIAFLGDDDAVMPRAFHIMRQVLTGRTPDIVMGTSYHYVWPAGEQPAELLWVPVREERRQIELRPLIDRTFRLGGAGYDRLPCAYRCFVRRTLFEKLSNATGRIFHSTAPDVFTTFALPAFCSAADHLGEPLFVSGQSRRQTQQMRQDWLRQWASEFTSYHMHKLLAHDLYPPHFHAFNVVADSALVASDFLPEYYAHKRFNLAAYYGWFLSSSRAVPYRELPNFLSKVHRAGGVNRAAILAWWALFRTYHTYSYWRLHKRAAAPGYANLAPDVASFAQQADKVSSAGAIALSPQ